MSNDGTETAVTVDPTVAEPDRAVQPAPRYHIVLYNDEDHTYEYVIEMLARLFGHSAQRGYQLACEVDTAGRAVVDTTSFERAELKRNQIRAFGADWRVMTSRGSMAASIEEAP